MRLPRSKIRQLLLWWSICISSLTPLIYIIEKLTQKEQINLFADLAIVTGHSAMVFIIITLAITPLRRWLIALFKLFDNIKWGKRLSDWNLLIRYRRLMGLMAFYYSTLHLGVYLYMELDFDMEELIYDINTRKHIIFGLGCWFLLIILAITSPKFVIKKIGRWWRRIHRSMYVLSILAVIHHIMAVKVTDKLPLLYFGIIAILLFHRLAVAYIKPLYRADDTGLEHNRNTEKANNHSNKTRSRIH